MSYSVLLIILLVDFLRDTYVKTKLQKQSEVLERNKNIVAGGKTL